MPEKTMSNPFEEIREFTVMGYGIGKTKNDRAWVRLDLFVKQNERFGAGYGSRAVFLPDDEQHKVEPKIVGKLCCCETDMFGKRTNFTFVD